MCVQRRPGCCCVSLDTVEVSFGCVGFLASTAARGDGTACVGGDSLEAWSQQCCVPCRVGPSVLEHPRCKQELFWHAKCTEQADTAATWACYLPLNSQEPALAGSNVVSYVMLYICTPSQGQTCQPGSYNFDCCCLELLCGVLHDNSRQRLNIYHIELCFESVKHYYLTVLRHFGGDSRFAPPPAQTDTDTSHHA